MNRRASIVVRPALWVCLGLALVAQSSPAFAQNFGKNKVQYEHFDWKMLETEHVEVLYYRGEEDIARRAAEYAEAACRELDRDLGHQLTKKLPLIVYKSHYDFRQNNVSSSHVGESTGGFTEIFRKRIVLPYSGSEGAFRHVIHHELVHAYVLDKLYGGSLRSTFILQYAFYLPLWFMEGIAEYYSNRWNSESEMLLRDAALQGTLRPFSQIYGGFFVYKAGWSAVSFLIERYGEDVIRDLLDDLETTRRIEDSIVNVTGVSLGEIAMDWLKETRRHTWPSLADLSEPDRLGRVLTKTREASLHSHPDLSPSGRWISFLSNESGTPDLYVLDLEDPQAEPVALIRGSRGGKFESLHPLRSSVGWSSDEQYVAVAAQLGARDALYVMEIETCRVVAEIVPDLDSVERPDWSPAAARIVFTGMKDGQVDLFVIDADGSNLVQLTDDLHREEAPVWSPDGTQIAFASDASGEGRRLWTIRYDGGDASPVLPIDPAASATTQATAQEGSPALEPTHRHECWDPAWAATGEALYFVSDEYGTRDLHQIDLSSGEVSRLSSLMGGVDSPSTAVRGTRLAATVFHRGRWDVVLVEEADTLSVREAVAIEILEQPWKGRVTPAGAVEPVASSGDSVVADADSTIIAQGPYRPRFRTEGIQGAFGYGTLGASGTLRLTLTDLLGNHRFDVGGELFRNLKDSDGVVTYAYLARRFDFGFSVFHIRDLLRGSRTSLGQPIGEEGDRPYFSERQWGVLGSVSYPFHTFRRVSFEATLLESERILFDGSPGLLGGNLDERERSRSKLLIPRLHHAFDNTLWGWSGPVQGTRSLLSLRHALPLGGDRISYTTVLGDYRRYVRFGGTYVLAFRTMAASSFGSDPEIFQMGGPNTIRGYETQGFRGHHAALFSAEFRYPFLEYVKFGWPIRSAFGRIRGGLFLDVGTAFERASDFRFSGRNELGRSALEDLKVGFGVGFRTRVAFLPLRLDVGWPTDFATIGSPRWHISLGPEY